MAPNLLQYISPFLEDCFSIRASFFIARLSFVSGRKEVGAISVTLQGRLLSCPQRKAQVVDSRGKGGKTWNQEKGLSDILYVTPMAWCWLGIINGYRK